MEDVQIIDLYWRRDEEAIRATDAKYGSFCHRLAMNILHSFQDSEECVSDTYGRCWDTMPPRRPGSLRAYLGTIIREDRRTSLRKGYQAVQWLLYAKNPVRNRKLLFLLMSFYVTILVHA